MVATLLFSLTVPLAALAVIVFVERHHESSAGEGNQCSLMTPCAG